MPTSWKEYCVKACLTLFWGGIIISVTLTYANESPFWEASKHRQDAIRVAPQGWAFFTRDPREATHQIYVRRDDRWEMDSRFYAGSRSFSELLKRNRLVHVELAHVLFQVEEDAWTPCSDSLSACTKTAGYQRVIVQNQSNLRNLCGRFLVERQPPVPWAWAASRDRVYMPAQLVELEVMCEDASKTAKKAPGAAEA